jgi:predicted DNA-binding ribbon-helix-helix protein
MIHKYSVKILGHLTSVSLEIEFWQELKRIAKQRNTTLENLITSIDTREHTNLSSAIRVFILQNRT